MGESKTPIIPTGDAKVAVAVIPIFKDHEVRENKVMIINPLRVC